MNLAAKLEQIHTQIQDAAKSVNRAPQSVTLVAVSKTYPIEHILEVHGAGQLDFGENRVQELREKHEQAPHLRWHMIGSLQRNKVKYIAPFVHLIHSVDSERLLQEIDKQAQKNERTIPCLLQLNISDEPNKSGFQEDEAEALLTRMDQYLQVEIRGLMGMAAFTDEQEVIRSQFQRLKQAFDRYQAIAHPRVQMQEMSMGMSGDFELAIEEGSTMVRVGSGIFGRRG